MATLSCAGSKLRMNVDVGDTFMVDASGYLAAQQAVIYADIVKGTGYHSLVNATIDSIGRDKITVQAYGRNAGYGASVICRDGSECNIDCEGTGCDDMDFICLSGAICNVDPVNCDGIRNKVDGIDCPNIILTMDSMNEEGGMELFGDMEALNNDEFVYGNVILSVVGMIGALFVMMGAFCVWKNCGFCEYDKYQPLK